MQAVTPMWYHLLSSKCFFFHSIFVRSKPISYLNLHHTMGITNKSSRSQQVTGRNTGKDFPPRKTTSFLPPRILTPSRTEHQQNLDSFENSLRVWVPSSLQLNILLPPRKACHRCLGDHREQATSNWHVLSQNWGRLAAHPLTTVKLHREVVTYRGSINLFSHLTPRLKLERKFIPRDFWNVLFSNKD